MFVEEISFTRAVTLYTRYASNSGGVVQQPSEGLSNYRDGTWYLQNSNGPLAEVSEAGQVVSKLVFQ